MQFLPTLLSLLLLPLASTTPVCSTCERMIDTSIIVQNDLDKRITNTSADTQNDLTNGLECKPLTVVYARGTNSPGNVGDQPGPQFFQAIADKIGLSNLAVQGVNYTATIVGFISHGDTDGSLEMAKNVAQAASQCPDTKIVVSGYSQGGQLVHNAAGMDQYFSDTVNARVSSVILYGDPDNGQAVGNISASKVLSFCHPNDSVCHGGFDATGEHLTYSNNVTEAANFVASQAGY